MQSAAAAEQIGGEASLARVEAELRAGRDGCPNGAGAPIEDEPVSYAFDQPDLVVMRVRTVDVTALSGAALRLAAMSTSCQRLR
jgi:hypothetical protein